VVAAVVLESTMFHHMVAVLVVPGVVPMELLLKDHLVDHLITMVVVHLVTKVVEVVLVVDPDREPIMQGVETVVKELL
jgi:hypothetical protein